MGCFSSKPLENANSNPYPVEPDLDLMGYDFYGYNARNQKPTDYSSIVTKDITKLRHKIKELQDERVDDQEAFVKSLFAHADELYPKPNLKDDSTSVSSRTKPTSLVDDAKWNKGVGFGNAAHETQKDMELKALLKQKELNFTQLLNVLLKNLPQLQEQRRIIAKRACSSSFMYIVENLCYNDSILDMTLHADLYKALLSVIDSFARDQILRVLVFQKTGPRASDKPLCEVMKDMAASASVYHKLSGAMGGEAGDPVSQAIASQITQVWDSLQRFGTRSALLNSQNLAQQQSDANNSVPQFTPEQEAVRKEQLEKEKAGSRERIEREAAEKAQREAEEKKKREEDLKQERERVEKELAAKAEEKRKLEEAQRQEALEKKLAALATGTDAASVQLQPVVVVPEKGKEPVVVAPTPAPVELTPASDDKGKGPANVNATPPPPPLPGKWKTAKPRAASLSQLDLVKAKDHLNHVEDAPTAVSHESVASALLAFSPIDSYGNAIHPHAKPEDRQPPASLKKFIDNPLLLQNPPAAPKYCDALREHLFGNAPINLDKHYHKSHFEKTMSKPKMNRLLSELGSLARSLPLAEGSSVFVRCDENRIDVMKALIVGPQGTPYQNGCFVFDVYLPAAYPNVPPQFQLRTTGGNTVRFNPNLYNDGKVCLSLLGTWQGEPWRPTSTLLQVLVSIQSLILVPHPYFNEPGWETYQGTPQGKELSKNYNDNLLGATVMWGMYNHLASPDEAFGDVIAAHMYLKRNELRQQCIDWLNQTRYPALLREPIDKLMLELEKLEAKPPAIVKPLLQVAY